MVQLCIVHMIRNSLKYVSYKDQKAVATGLKKIYQAVNKKQAEEALVAFRKEWDRKYPIIGDLWSRHWEGIIPFLSFPANIRKAIYTTNAIESLNRSLRRVLKTKGGFPTEQSAMKLIYLAIQRASKKWTMPIHNWSLALNQFAIHFPGRVSLFDTNL